MCETPQLSTLFKFRNKVTGITVIPLLAIYFQAMDSVSRIFSSHGPFLRKISELSLGNEKPSLMDGCFQLNYEPDCGKVCLVYKKSQKGKSRSVDLFVILAVAFAVFLVYRVIVVERIFLVAIHFLKAIIILRICVLSN